ncbi:bifunctional acetate--CoA ligase family protein/GNAT family N-acetyltransferase [Hansschlegelia sp.]|uniref:bifunctional acetate--CoA ligase family protein/GNAT family N-acetyltransferase n=1 Tax=Hansschlegelia sp. TaxID=2041892 RepID=UPI002C9DB424|nr:bifunctional acetate--CoA ligase family protein/GNAT family N-acetyltransferase [Hansschlegelia sp.]HVI27413.1 bifunctional acetate--CoA ligase family protein/GNAT family N-acetyltransferase [Hansschlegelia sp.]
MSSFGLDRLFQPRSVAVVGASERAGSLGRAVLDNLEDGGFTGPVHAVNPNHGSIRGRKAFASLRDIEAEVDLAVVCTPPSAVRDVIQAAADKRIGAALILTAGLSRGAGSESEAIAAIAAAGSLRLLGPNAFGLLAPHARLNASFAARTPAAGDLALISQSGAIAAALVARAATRNLGFSAVASLGDALDVDVADCLDHLAGDRRTRAILLYLEGLTDAAKFMSAARAAARVKPVVVVKGGRHAAGAKAVATHTGALAGSDAAYSAAFRRAGLLRVFDLGGLFTAAEALGRRQADRGDRLAILTNGGGAGVLAVDRHLDLGGTLATLSAGTLAALDAVLPKTWSRANPVDIIGDADPARFAAATELLLNDPQVDALIVLDAPTALASSSGVAEAVIAKVRDARARADLPKPVFAAWLGCEAEIAAAFAAAGVPHFGAENEAVEAFAALVRSRHAQDALNATPAARAPENPAARAAARATVQRALREKRSWLDPIEAAEVLSAFGVPVAAGVAAADAEGAAEAAAGLLRTCEAVTLKIRSRAIQHKSDVGGVRLDLRSDAAVREAAVEMLERVRRLRPDANDLGLLVQPMIKRPNARELIVGLTDDATFGPIVLFGRGGVGVEIYRDTALGLPPLDRALAADLISQTQVSRTLAAYRDVPAAALPPIQDALIGIADIAAEIPEILSIDINPLLADEQGAIAVDARVALVDRAASRVVIRPYPAIWSRELVTRSGARFPSRPVRAEDEALIGRLLARTDPEDLRLRFFAPVRHLEHGFLTRLVHLDYARSIAFVALDADGEAAGVVRLHCDADRKSGEFAVLVRTDLKGRGLGWALMQLMLDWARAEGVERVEGDVLRANTEMSAMCREMGFVASPAEGDATRFVLELAGRPETASDAAA